MPAESKFWVEDPTRVDRLKELVAQDLPYREIGRQLGCTKNMAMGKAKRLKLATRNRPGGYAAPRAKRDRPAPITKIGGAWAQTPTPAKPRPPPRIRRVDVESADVPLVAVKGCLYPTNDAPLGGEHLFCDRPKHPEHSYCAEHASLCFTAVPPPRHLVVPGDTSARARATAAFRTWRTA